MQIFRSEEQWHQEEKRTHLQPVTGAAIWGHTVNLLDFNFQANFNNPSLWMFEVAFPLGEAFKNKSLLLGLGAINLSPGDDSFQCEQVRDLAKKKVRIGRFIQLI